MYGRYQPFPRHQHRTNFSQENGSFFCCQFLCCGPLQFESGCKNVLIAPYENSVPRRQVITTLLPGTVKLLKKDVSSVRPQLKQINSQPTADDKFQTFLPCRFVTFKTSAVAQAPPILKATIFVILLRIVRIASHLQSIE